MGNNAGTYTEKAVISYQLYPYTKWGNDELKKFMIRGMHELPETFGIRKHEFIYLVGAEEHADVKMARSLYDEIFDTDKNGLVDKAEIMCIICLVSSLSTEDKIGFFFDLFNFNDKGYLLESEMVLLMMAISRGVFKIDQKFLPPVLRIVQKIALESLKYAKLEATQLRKPDLVRFVINNGEISSFLECWRGHASQVLIPEGMKFRDLSFPANISSIIPTSYWAKLGLPPGSFVHWRRLEDVGTELGCDHLFAHQTSFLKTYDRRVTYTGDGILGRGFIKQGMLADGWFLNALSMISGKPEILLNSFVMTGQEGRGRYCIKFYEAGSWRTIYVDDRIPCSALLNPLFASSSCSYESWVMLYEKALGKYLGSYGHLGLCGVRGDSVLYGLRMLTGAHCFQYLVSDYEWNSTELEVTTDKRPSGVDFVFDFMDEGSLIAFGKSAPSALMDKPPPGMNIFPYGKLFPLVGSVNTHGYLYFIFKDTWGLIQDSNMEVNFESGHSNTFQIKVDDLSKFYDTFIVGRYPDCIRTLTEKLNIPSWFTETKSSITKDRLHPAKFLLHVPLSPQNGKAANSKSAKRRFGKTRRRKPTVDKKEYIEKVLAVQDEKPVDDLAGIRLKDRYDFSKANDKLNNPTSSSTKKEKAKDGEGEEDQVNDLVHICLTFSSCCEWSFAGSALAAPKIRIRIIPSKSTIHSLKRRREVLQRMKQREDRKMKKRLSKLPQSSTIPSSGAGLGAAILSGNKSRMSMMSPAANTPLATSTRASEIHLSRPTSGKGQGQGDGEMKGDGMEEEDEFAEKPLEEEESFDMIFTNENLWMTKNLQLAPGKYYILVDVEYAVPYEEIRKRSLPRNITESPWLESIIHAWVEQQKVKVDNTFHFNKFFTRKFDGSGIPEELIAFESNLFSSIEELKQEEIDRHNAAHGKEGDGVDRKKIELDHRIWLEVSSTDALELTAINDNDTAQAALQQYIEAEMFGGMEKKELPEIVEIDRCPFLTETQLDVSSRELVNLMTFIREEAEIAGEEFVNIAETFRQDRSKTLKKKKKDTK